MNPKAPPTVSPDAEEIPPGSNLWYEGAYDPNPGHPDSPTSGVDPDKSDPNSPNYDPNFDPKVHNPEIPVPGLDNTVPIIEHPDGGTYVPKDIEAPSSEAQMVRNENAGFPVLINFFKDGELFFSVRAQGPIGSRIVIRSVILMLLGSKETIRLQYQVWSYSAQMWIDPSLDELQINGSPWPDSWDGMMNAELQIKGGLGDKI